MYGAEAEAARLDVPTRRLAGGLVSGRDSWSKDVMQATGVGPLPRLQLRGRRRRAVRRDARGDAHPLVPDHRLRQRSAQLHPPRRPGGGRAGDGRRRLGPSRRVPAAGSVLRRVQRGDEHPAAAGLPAVHDGGDRRVGGARGTGPLVRDRERGVRRAQAQPRLADLPGLRRSGRRRRSGDRPQLGARAHRQQRRPDDAGRLRGAGVPRYVHEHPSTRRTRTRSAATCTRSTARRATESSRTRLPS